MSIKRNYVDILGYTIWYGAFILVGITLGLFVRPFIADAAILYDNLTVWPTGGSLGSGTYYTDQSYFNTTDYAQCNILKMENTISLDAITMVITPNATENAGNRVMMQIWRMGVSTTTIGDTLSTGFLSDFETLATSTSIWATTTFTFSGNIMYEDEYYCMGFYDIDETVVSATNGVKARYSTTGTSTGWIYTLPAPAAANTIQYARFYDDLNDVYQYGNSTNQDRQFIKVEGSLYSTVEQPEGSYIASVTPTLYSYGNTSTSTVSANVYITPEDKARYTGLEVGFTCIQSPYANPWYDGGYLQEFGYSADGCNEAEICSIEAVDMLLNDDKQYDCWAKLSHDGGWWDFRQTIYTYNWSFYTFESSSSPEAVVWRDKQYAEQTNTNYTGTSTDDTRPFAACEWSQLDITDCLIAPFKFMFVPSTEEMARNINEMHNIVFTHFPFNIVWDIQQTIRDESESYATTTATTTFPSMSFETADMNGVTTTVTIFDGEEFTSTWSQYEMFDTIRTVTSSAMYLIFFMLVFYRLRRLVPTSDNIKSV